VALMKIVPHQNQSKGAHRPPRLEGLEGLEGNARTWPPCDPRSLKPGDTLKHTAAKSARNKKHDKTRNKYSRLIDPVSINFKTT
jgi:hypothetical protein